MFTLSGLGALKPLNPRFNSALRKAKNIKAVCVATDHKLSNRHNKLENCRCERG